MLNIIESERMKLKRNRLLQVCSIISILFPIFMIFNHRYQHGSLMPEEPVITYVFSLQTFFQFAMYPILSVFIITFLIQKEYGDQTIINILTAPVERTKFLLGKIIVWFAWHILITLCFLVIMCVGIIVLYNKVMLFENLFEIIKMILKAGILKLVVLLPVIWIAILQRKTFYWSIIFVFIVTIIGNIGLYWSPLIGSIVPWSAATKLSALGGDVSTSIAYTSISIYAILGFALIIYTFQKQDL